MNDAISMPQLKEIMDDNMELIRDCFSDFLIEWPDMYREIQDAANHNNFKALDESAHKLKGSLTCLAAQKAARAAFGLEAAGREQNPENLEQKLELLESECEKVVRFIEKFKYPLILPVPSGAAPSAIHPVELPSASPARP